jgi:hypothetical protein
MVFVQAWRTNGSKAVATAEKLQNTVKKMIAALPDRS